MAEDSSLRFRSAASSESAGQLLLTAANEVHDNKRATEEGRGAVLLDLGPQCQSDLAPCGKPSVPPSQAVLFRSSWAASSHNEIANVPIRPVSSSPFPG